MRKGFEMYKVLFTDKGQKLKGVVKMNEVEEFVETLDKEIGLTPEEREMLENHFSSASENINEKVITTMWEKWITLEELKEKGLKIRIKTDKRTYIMEYDEKNNLLMFRDETGKPLFGIWAIDEGFVEGAMIEWFNEKLKEEIEEVEKVSE